MEASVRGEGAYNERLEQMLADARLRVTNLEAENAALRRRIAEFERNAKSDKLNGL